MDALTREPVLAPQPSRTRRWSKWLLCALVTACIGVAIWRWPVAPPADKAALLREANQVIPIVQAAAIKRDMPVWLDGLGTVQAFQTVTVKTMVDGPLTDVAFTEGQSVHVGDVLVRIDPRVYQAALDMVKRRARQPGLGNHTFWANGITVYLCRTAAPLT